MKKIEFIIGNDNVAIATTIGNEIQDIFNVLYNKGFYPKYLGKTLVNSNRVYGIIIDDNEECFVVTKAVAQRYIQCATCHNCGTEKCYNCDKEKFFVAKRAEKVVIEYE